MAGLPSSVLFACTTNAVRSPMAEAILKYFHGSCVYVDSVGLRRGDLDGFAVAVMDEIGIDLSRHRPKTFDDLEDTSFDMVISLSPEAQHRAVELTRTRAIELALWNTFDPTIIRGSREGRLAAYREVREALMERILAHFPLAPLAKP